MLAFRPSVVTYVEGLRYHVLPLRFVAVRWISSSELCKMRNHLELRWNHSIKKAKNEPNDQNLDLN